MRVLKHPTSFALLAFVFLGASSEGADSPLGEPCPGAASWNRSHPALPQSSHGGVNTAPADGALFTELQTRVERDQSARREWLANSGSEELARSVDAIDAENLVWLRELATEKGFPTAAQVGNEGVHLAWILLQHADQDPGLQRQLLPVLETRYSAGELPANDLARMTDRILIASGKSQKYGTQFDWFSGSFQLPEATQLAEIDAERSRLGLMPLRDYVCTIRKERENVVVPAATPQAAR